MAVKLITYDLNKETVRPNITKRIHDTWPTWAMLSESTYVVQTNMTHVEVYDRLFPLLDGDDALFVFDLKQPIAGIGPKDVVEWLESQLPY